MFGNIKKFYEKVYMNNNRNLIVAYIYFAFAGVSIELKN